MSRSIMNILPKSIKDYISSNRVYLFLRTRKALRKFFPVTTYFEITSYCNLKCKGCYRTLHSYPAKNKHMSFQDFKTYLDQLPHTRRLTLNGLGEPALNPDMLKMVKYARNSGKVDVIDFTTNALACEPEFYDNLFSHGLSMMDISVDSLDQKEVKGLRSPTNVKLLAKNIKYLVNKYPDKTLCRVVVSKKNIDTFQNTIYNLIKMGTKTISCVPFDDFGNSELPLSPKEKTTFLKKYNQLKREYPHIYLDASNWFEPVTSPCCNPYNQAVVTVDGYLSPCCRIFDNEWFNFGNLKDKSFKELFFSKEYNRLQKNMLKGKYPLFCRGCMGNHVENGEEK